MAQAVFRTFEHWQRIILGGLVARAGLSDVSQGSVARVMCAVVAQCLDELSYNAGNLRLAFGVDTAAGPDLDARAEDIVPGTLQRMAARPATALVTFSRLANAGSVTVPAGCQVQSPDGVVFSTLADVSLADGVLSQSGIAVQANQLGAAGNLAAGQLTIFAGRPVGIDQVSQPAAAQGGVDQESDDSFRARIYQYVAGLSYGTAAALVSNVVGQQDPLTGDTIVSANVVEYPVTRPAYSELYIADAAGTNEGKSTPLDAPDLLTRGLLGPPPDTATGGETRFRAAHRPIDPQAAYQLTSSTRGVLSEPSSYRLEPASGVFYLTAPAAQGESFTATYSYQTGIIALAQKIVDGDGTQAFPGIRMAGSVVLVRSPQLLPLSVDGSLVTAAGYDQAQAVAAAEQAINSYLASLPIGGSVVTAKIIAIVMSLPGLVDFALTSPASDVIVGPNQLIRPGKVTLS